ncbi:putative G-protein coupled receptor Mth-like 8 [Bienertia sinuspersici]
MKLSRCLVASFLAASTFPFFSNSSQFQLKGKPSYNAESSSSSIEKDKFAPRFDGLRFIETLITAHR